MPQYVAFGQFVALDEQDAPSLLVRLANCDLPVDSSRYGISSRLIARAGAEVSDLAAAVLAKLLQATAVAGGELGAVVLSSRIVEPASAARSAAAQLGLACHAEGIERACSGFPAATRRAMELCRTDGRPVAVVATEIISRSINWEPAGGSLADHKRARGQASKLFADGAAAVLVGPLGAGCPHEILDAWQGEVPDEQQLIQKLDVEDAVDPFGNVIPGKTGCISMPGRRGYWLVKRAPQIMADSIEQSLGHARTSGRLGDGLVSHVVPHQPNGLILARLQKQFNEAHQSIRVWSCIENMGNTVSASIPLAMSAVQDQLPADALVALPSVGAGGPGYRPDVLSTGCVLIRIGKR